MAWWESVVRIEREGALGSGVFVGADLVLTAGHVVQPMGSVPPALGDLAVTVPFRGGARLAVRTVRIHDRWQASNFLLADVAVLRVKAMDGVGLGVWRGFGNEGIPQDVALYGYPADSITGSYQTGLIVVSGDASDERYGTIESRDFDIQPGVSGSPFVTEYSDGNVYVVGLATWDSKDPAAIAFNGLPLLSSTYDEILAPFS